MIWASRESTSFTSFNGDSSITSSRLAGLTSVAAPVGSSEGESVESFDLVIQPRSGWIGINWKEMISHRELLFYLVWRDISVRYKQTVLGPAWAILQPLILMLIFTVIFGRFVKIDSEGFDVSGLRLRGADPLDIVFARHGPIVAESRNSAATLDQGVFPAVVRADRRSLCISGGSGDFAGNLRGRIAVLPRCAELDDRLSAVADPADACRHAQHRHLALGPDDLLS